MIVHMTDFVLFFSTTDEYSPQRKVSEKIFLQLLREEEFCKTELAAHFVKLLLSYCPHISCRRHYSVFLPKCPLFSGGMNVSNSTRFLSFRAKHFSTNWAWKRTGSSPDAHRGRPRKVSRKTWRSSHIPPIIRSFQRSRKETFSLKCRTMGIFPRNYWECLGMHIPKLWRKNSFCLMRISFCFF